MIVHELFLSNMLIESFQGFFLSGLENSLSALFESVVIFVIHSKHKYALN